MSTMPKEEYRKQVILMRIGKYNYDEIPFVLIGLYVITNLFMYKEHGVEGLIVGLIFGILLYLMPIYFMWRIFGLRETVEDR